MRGSQTKFSYFDAVEWRARQSPYLFHARWFNGLSSGSQVFIVVVSARTNKSHHHHGCVDIWKTLKAVSQMRDCPVCDCRKGSPHYPYNTVSAGVLGGTGYPTTARPTAFKAAHQRFGNVVVVYYTVPIIKLFAWGGGMMMPFICSCRNKK